MRYLITGGAGFIGSHVVESLIGQGHKVTVLDDFSTGKHENISGFDLTLVEGSICDERAVVKAIEACDGVFHLAAIASVTKSVEEWTNTHEINQSGAVRVFEAAANRSIPVVYASSAAVYGDCANLPLKEVEQTQPLTPYGLDKLACEWQANVGQKIKGLSSAGMRFFNVYGPRQDPKSPYSGVISIFMDRCVTKKGITIYGDGEQTRDFIFVKDVVAHLQAAMQMLQTKKIQCEVFNVCTGTQTSVNQLAQVLNEISQANVSIDHHEARQGDIRFSCGEPQKAIQTLQTSASTTLHEGLKETWDSMCASSLPLS